MQIAPNAFPGRRYFPPPPPLTTTNLRHQNAQIRRPNFTIMPLTDLTFKRITTTPYHQFRLKYPFSLNNNNLVSISRKSSMADDSKKIDTQSENVKENESEKSRPENSPPPPPEKPLAGDCCGSGCVRCVWDVYYEELEDYERLCKAADSKKS